MTLKRFIDRPILSTVISVVIILIGIVSLFSLPVELYPDMAPPTIQVYATYPGANAETVQKAVVVPLEEAINGVEDMLYITSTASNNGDATINIYFRQKSNADMAAVNVQNRVSRALSSLPAEVTRMGVSTEKQQNAELKTFALYAPDDRYDRQFLNNYMKINVEPRIKRISGVDNMMLFGSNYSMRIWLRPDKMALYHLVPADIARVLEGQNIEAATGSLGENADGNSQYTMKYRGRLSTAEEFGNLVVRHLPEGGVLHLREVSDVELGDEAYNYSTGLNGHEAALAMVYQKAGSNASATIDEIDRVLADISREMPQGLEFVTLNDTNRFLKASIREVVKTLVEAILLVVLVVYVFLQDMRSTLIPTISIFVSVIGTFAFLALMGFTINLLTLFALVLAIGTVVDDAIVVVEAVQARFDAGCRSAYTATCDAMQGIASAILTSTLVFMAVFIPVSMMGGTSGEFYRQFGLTMAVAVGLSAVNAFTLSPALCALLLKPYKDAEGNERQNFAARFRTAFNAVFDVLVRRYVKGVVLMVKRRWCLWAAIAASCVLLVVLMRSTKTGLVPEEDSGSVMISLNTRPGTSQAQTRRIMKQMDERLADIPEIEYRSNVAGYALEGVGPSMGMYFISLLPWEQRKGSGHAVNDVIRRINALAPEIPDASMLAMTTPMISGYGMGSGFELYLQDRTGGDILQFKQVADEFQAALMQRPEIGAAYSAFQTDYPQYWVDIDPAQCEVAGLSPGEVLQTIAGYFSGSYVSDFNRFNKLYHVNMQAAAEARMSPESLHRIYVRTAGGQMAPLSQFVRLTKSNGPSDLSRFNLYNSISINGSAAPGYSTGQALQAIRETADSCLPQGYGYELGGLSREEGTTTSNTTLIFGICLLLVYLILCALYESLFVPLAVLLAIPSGLLGSFLFAQLFGLENNIYMQTGLIMLIGLLAKTAILLTEYAVARRERGLPLVQSAYYAAVARLRPILMTALTMVFGLLPLMVATGVGANGSRSLATTAVGGMLVGTLALLFAVPALFIVFRWVHERWRMHSR